MRIRSVSIRFWLPLLIMGLLSLSLALTSLLNSYDRYSEIASRGAGQAQEAVKALKPLLARHLATVAWAEVQSDLESVVAGMPGRNGAALLGADGRVLMASRREWSGLSAGQALPGFSVDAFRAASAAASAVSQAGDDAVRVYQALPLPNGAAPLVLYLARDLTPLHQAFWREQLSKLLPLWAMGAAVTLILVLVLNRVISQPLVILADHARRLGFGNYGATVEVGGGSELATLARALNEMSLSMRSNLKAVHDREQELNESVDAMPLGVIVFNGDGSSHYANRMAKTLLGRSIEINEEVENLTMVLGLLRAGSTRHYSSALFERAFAGEAVGADDAEIVRNGTRIPLQLWLSPVFDRNNRVRYVILAFDDITLRKQSEARIQHLAHFDFLTDLPNRLAFHQRCEAMLESARREGRQVALLFMDLDRFKQINDSLGHTVGDTVLQSVARRLGGHIRQGDFIARLGGDEFVVLMDRTDGIEDAVALCLTLLHALEPAIKVGEHELHVDASIGISLFPQDGEDAVSLLANADAAMYRAKARGRNTYEFYTADLTSKAMERMQLENDLRGAIERGELVMHYQPQIALGSNAVIGCEALVRWQRGNTRIAPDKFIPLAEESWLIVPLGEWTLRESCRQMKAWIDSGMDIGRVAVNVSGAQIQRADIVATVKRVLDETGLSPRHLELELTESFVMSDPARHIPVLEELRAMGIQLAIDDFGTGYSSLSYLKRLPIDKLKIDKSFIDGIPEQSHDCGIAKAILAMAHTLGLKVLAEGVETAPQRAFLSANGCDSVQGYLYSRPLDAEAYRAFVGQTRLQAVGAAA